MHDDAPESTRPDRGQHRCGTDLAPCGRRATFALRWPSEREDRHLCDDHMGAMAAASQPRLLDVRPLDGARLVAHVVDGEEVWHVER